MGKVKVITVAVLLIDAVLLNDMRGISKVVFSKGRKLSAERSEISEYGAYMRPGNWLLFILDDGIGRGIRLDSVTLFKTEYSLWIGGKTPTLIHGRLFFFESWEPWYLAYLDLTQTHIICLPETNEKLFLWMPSHFLYFISIRLEKVAVYTGDQPISEELFQSDSILWKTVDHSPSY